MPIIKTTVTVRNHGIFSLARLRKYFIGSYGTGHIDKNSFVKFSLFAIVFKFHTQFIGNRLLLFKTITESVISSVCNKMFMDN